MVGNNIYESHLKCYKPHKERKAQAEFFFVVATHYNFL